MWFQVLKLKEINKYQLTPHKTIEWVARFWHAHQQLFKLVFISLHTHSPFWKWIQQNAISDEHWIFLNEFKIVCWWDPNRLVLGDLMNRNADLNEQLLLRFPLNFPWWADGWKTGPTDRVLAWNGRSEYQTWNGSGIRNEIADIEKDAILNFKFCNFVRHRSSYRDVFCLIFDTFFLPSQELHNWTSTKFQINVQIWKH